MTTFSTRSARRANATPRHQHGLRRTRGVVAAASVLVSILTGVAHADTPPAGPIPGANVAFGDCSEYAGITTIAVAEARTVVPTSFTLAGDSTGAPFVVRVVHCDAISVDGGSPAAATVAQLGISVVSADGTGDINNYTAWYLTNHQPLARALRRLRVPAHWTPQLRYDLVPGDHPRAATLTIAAAPPRGPAVRVDASVTEPATSAVPFEANWWIRSGRTVTKMNTPIPQLRFGAAAAVLHTTRTGQLVQLLGSSTTTFPLLDSFNRFSAATMTVTQFRADQPRRR